MTPVDWIMAVTAAFVIGGAFIEVLDTARKLFNG